MSTVEVVRFEVPAERADDLVAGHERARRAIDSVAPGWIWSRLARFDERRWIEVVTWSERAAFERALELSVAEPDAADWFGLADPGWTIVLGAPVAGSVPAPPREGTMEIASSRTGEEAALVAIPEGRPAWSLLLDLEDRVWSGDSWKPAAPRMMRLTVPAPDTRGAPSWTEVATVAHSYDAPAAVGPA